MAGIAIIFESYLDAIEDLPDEEQLALYRAISRYSIKDEEPELTGIAKTIFTVIRPTIDANKDKSAQARELANKRWNKNKNTAYDTACDTAYDAHDATHNAAHDAHDDAHTDAHDAERKCNVRNSNDKDSVKDRGTGKMKGKGEEESSGQEAASPPSAPTRAYGTFKNVHLTVEEVTDLMRRFPEDWNNRIEQVSTYKESVGKKYKSDFATILNWDAKNEQEGKGRRKKKDIDAYCQGMADWAERTETIQEGEKPPNE